MVIGVVRDGAFRQQRHLTTEGEGTEARRFQPDEGGLEGLTRRAAIDTDALGGQLRPLLTVNESSESAISPDCGLKKVSIWNTPDQSLDQGLDALQADPRLAHVAGRQSESPTALFCRTMLPLAAGR